MDKRFLLAEVKATGDDGAEFESVLSAPTLDRDFEIIDTNAFAPLPASIPIHAFHDFHDPVGRGVPYYDGDVLKVKGMFASTARAQEIRTLVKEGIIGSMSVGFMPPTREKGEDGVDHITHAEILEGSFVSVPSNRESAVLMAKDYREAALKVGARNSADDAARMQAIHDLATEVGAKCAPIIELMEVEDAETKDQAAQLVAQLDVKTKGDENSDGPVMAPAEQARLAIARAEADLLLT